MKPETPATGIMKKADYGDSVWYEVPCDCGSNEHYHSIWIEADPEVGDISVNIYTESNTDYWTTYLKEHAKTDNEFLYQIWWRFAYTVNEIVRRSKLIWKILFRGYIKYQSNVMLTEQQALNYAEALKRSIEDVKDFKKP